MRTIEFMGMPRAGKTTQVTLLRNELQKLGYSTATLDDRLRPGLEYIPAHESLAFIAARAANALAFYFKCVQNGTDFLLFDRGINDTLAFSYVYQVQGRITQEESSAIHALLSRYFTLTDTTFLFSVPTDVSISRHRATGIHHPIDDIVMTPSYLGQLQKGYARNSKYFSRVTAIDGLDSIESTAQKILESLKIPKA